MKMVDCPQDLSPKCQHEVELLLRVNDYPGITGTPVSQEHISCSLIDQGVLDSATSNKYHTELVFFEKLWLREESKNLFHAYIYVYMYAYTCTYIDAYICFISQKLCFILIIK